MDRVVDQHFEGYFLVNLLCLSIQVITYKYLKIKNSWTNLLTFFASSINSKKYCSIIRSYKIIKQ